MMQISVQRIQPTCTVFCSLLFLVNHLFSPLFFSTNVLANEPTENQKVSQERDQKIVIVQVRDEVHRPNDSTSTLVDDYTDFIKGRLYHSSDKSFRLLIPILGSGKINIIRRHWEKPDGIDVKFIDEKRYWRAVFSMEPNFTPKAEKLEKKYNQYLATKKTKYETEIISTRFGNTVQIVALNQISSRYYPYDPPVIDASKEKLEKIGKTVGISWTFWKDRVQYGINMVMPIENESDDKLAFRFAKEEIKKISEGLQLKKIEK